MTVLSASDADSLVAVLLSGVQNHLQASDEAPRRLGMRVAVVVSRVIDPNHPLNFDASSSDDECEVPKDTFEPGSEEGHQGEVTTQSTPVHAAGIEYPDEDEDENPDAPARLPGLRSSGTGKDGKEGVADYEADSDSSYEALDLTDDRSD